MPKDSPIIPLNYFTGINNLQDPMALNQNELVDAINIDVNRKGLLQTRNPIGLIRPCTDGHSLDDDNYYNYFVNENNLYKRDSNGNETLMDIGYKGLTTRYFKDNATNNLIISNDKFIKRYYKGKIYNITPETYDNNDITISFGSGGGFPVGRYLVSLTFLHDDGIEGGTNPSKVVEIKNDGDSIILNNLQITSDINVNTVRVYISDLNSQTLKHYGDYSIDIDNIVINYSTQLGKFLTHFNKDPMHPGSLVEKYRGILFTAKEKIIYLSEPLGYLTSNNYLEFESNITLLISVNDGLYVGDEHCIYFLSGTNPLDLNKKLIYNASAVKYTQRRNKITNDVFFFTSRGQIVGTDGGQIENLTESKFLPEADYKEGASLVMIENGLRKIINSFKKEEENNSVFGDWAKCEIIRN